MELNSHDTAHLCGKRTACTVQCWWVVDRAFCARVGVSVLGGWLALDAGGGWVNWLGEGDDGVGGSEPSPCGIRAADVACTCTWLEKKISPRRRKFHASRQVHLSGPHVTVQSSTDLPGRYARDRLGRPNTCQRGAWSLVVLTSLNT